MSLLVVVLISAAVLLIAYYTYGPLLTRLLRLDPDRPTPAVELRDDVDYVPIESKFLLSQHFSAIAAAGPIVGPILAGAMFGWLPALLWILLGAIFIGGIHDMTALVASIRHKARSIAEVVREHMSPRAYLLFLIFVWIALVYIIVAFTDITASSFVGSQVLEDGRTTVLGGGIASSSLMYLVLPIVMGLLLKYTDLSVGWATVIFLPLVALSIWLGQYIPLDLGALFGWSDTTARSAWNVVLLLYCAVASVIPMWLLLQPRGHLGGYFLYVVLAAGALGVMFGGFTVQYPAFRGWAVGPLGSETPLFPILFITIACGACSGFHSIIASGTTSKQLETETDAQPVGYGSMLLESMVAVVSLCCVMMLATDNPLVADPAKIRPNYLYANGIGNFMALIGVSPIFAVSFGLMAFTTFIYDTLDVCTRLGRYIIQELTGMSEGVGMWVGTLLTAGVPAFFLIFYGVDAQGKPIEAWKLYWALFGASNQLLAALTLLGVTVWLWRTYRGWWVLPVAGLPCLLMYVMSMWALSLIMWPAVLALGQLAWPETGPATTPVPYVAALLVLLGVWLLIEAILAIFSQLPPAAVQPSEQAAKVVPEGA